MDKNSKLCHLISDGNYLYIFKQVNCGRYEYVLDQINVSNKSPIIATKISGNGVTLMW